MKGLAIQFLQPDVPIVPPPVGGVVLVFLRVIPEAVDFPQRDVPHPCLAYQPQMTRINTDYLFCGLHFIFALLSAIPIPDLAFRGKKREILRGEVRSPVNLPPGCRFAARCPKAREICRQHDFELKEVSAGHFVACVDYEGVFICKK